MVALLKRLRRDSVRPGRTAPGLNGRREGMADRHPLLIVDDEEDVLLSLRSLFRRRYEVFTATRAREALERLESTDVHIVVTDQRMPDLNGVEFLAEVRRRRPNAVPVMITGYADIQSVIAAVNEGHVFRYIAKPWDPLELEAAVRQAAEQYEAHEERRRLLRELDEANQLKTAFITLASHEFNTPLTIVAGMIQLAISKNADEKVHSYLARAQRATERLQRALVSTFKLLQQKDFRRSLECELVVLEEAFLEIQEELEPYLRERNQTLDVAVTPPGARLRISRNHLRDVLANLLTNAIKFSSDGSAIGLEARQDAERTRLLVRDRGLGIAIDDQPHVFEPFFSTWDMTHHSSGDFGYGKRGLGLGLAIVRKFVEMHGGTISFESAPGEGTNFRIEFPNFEEAP